MKSLSISCALATVATVVSADSVRILFPFTNSTFTIGTTIPLVYELEVTYPTDNTTAAIRQADFMVKDVTGTNTTNSQILGVSTSSDWNEQTTYIHNATFIPDKTGIYQVIARANATWACGESLQMWCLAMLSNTAIIEVFDETSPPSQTLSMATSSPTPITNTSQPIAAVAANATATATADAMTTSDATTIANETTTANCTRTAHTRTTALANSTATAIPMSNFNSSVAVTQAVTNVTVTNVTSPTNSSSSSITSDPRYQAGYSLGITMMNELQMGFSMLSSNQTNSTNVTTRNPPPMINLGLLDTLLGGIFGSNSDPCSGLIGGLLCALLGSNPLTPVISSLGGSIMNSNDITSNENFISTTNATSTISLSSPSATPSAQSTNVSSIGLPSLDNGDFSQAFDQYWSNSITHEVIVNELADDLTKAGVDLIVLTGIEDAITSWLKTHTTQFNSTSRTNLTPPPNDTSTSNIAYPLTNSNQSTSDNVTMTSSTLPMIGIVTSTSQNSFKKRSFFPCPSVSRRARALKAKRRQTIKLS